MTRPISRTNLEAPRSIVLVSGLLFALGYQTSANTPYSQDQTLELTGTRRFVFSKFIYWFTLVIAGSSFRAAPISTLHSPQGPLKIHPAAAYFFWQFCRPLFLILNEEYSVDLVSGFNLRKANRPFLWPVTDLYKLVFITTLMDNSFIL
jgi:hypothetical protein